MQLPENTIITPVFRTMFPALFRPTTMKDQKNATPKYKVEALFEDPSQLGPLQELVKKVAHKQWGANLPPKMKQPLRDGSERTLKDKVTPNPDYQGKVFCTLSSLYQVPIVGRDKLPITDENLIYPGVNGRAIVTCKTFNTAGSIGVTLYLQLYQLVGGGDRVIPQMDQYLPDDLPEVPDTWGTGMPF